MGFGLARLVAGLGGGLAGLGDCLNAPLESTLEPELLRTVSRRIEIAGIDLRLGSIECLDNIDDFFDALPVDLAERALGERDLERSAVVVWWRRTFAWTMIAAAFSLALTEALCTALLACFRRTAACTAHAAIGRVYLSVT